MAHVVVLGGSTAGLLAAYEIADLAGPDDRVTMVADRRVFCSPHAAPWVDTGGARQAPVSFPLEATLTRRRIAFAQQPADRIDPDERCIRLADGSTLGYDFLVIACGPKPCFDEIEGLGPDGYTHSICHADHLEACAAGWQALVADPGPVIVGAAQGAPCIGPAYDMALQIAAALRRAGVQHRAPISFVTPEPYVGELGLGGLADSPAVLASALADAGIGVLPAARIARVERTAMWIQASPDGAQRMLCLPYRFALVTPPLRPIDAVAGIPGLADERGAIIVDDFMRARRYPNIYAAGVAVAGGDIPECEKRRPYVAGAMTSVVAQNIRDAIDGKRPGRTCTWTPMRLAHLGASGAAFIEEHEGGERAAGWFRSAGWTHMSQCATCDVAN